MTMMTMMTENILIVGNSHADDILEILSKTNLR